MPLWNRQQPSAAPTPAATFAAAGSDAERQQLMFIFASILHRTRPNVFSEPSIDDDGDIEMRISDVPVYLGTKADSNHHVLVHGYPLFGIEDSAELRRALHVLEPACAPARLLYNRAVVAVVTTVDDADVSFEEPEPLVGALIAVQKAVFAIAEPLKDKFGGRTWQDLRAPSDVTTVLQQVADESGGTLIAHAPRPAGQSIVLRDEDGVDGTRLLEAVLAPNGDLSVIGTDRGPGVSRVFGEAITQYKWTHTVAACDVPALLEAIGASKGADVLRAVADAGAERLSAAFRAEAVPVRFSNWHS